MCSAQLAGGPLVCVREDGHPDGCVFHSTTVDDLHTLSEAHDD